MPRHRSDSHGDDDEDDDGQNNVDDVTPRPSIHETVRPPFAPIPIAPIQINPVSMVESSLSSLGMPKTRRRRGSLRKAALLGRGAQRERVSSGLGISVSMDATGMEQQKQQQQQSNHFDVDNTTDEDDALHMSHRETSVASTYPLRGHSKGEEQEQKLQLQHQRQQQLQQQQQQQHQHQQQQQHQQQLLLQRQRQQQQLQQKPLSLPPKQRATSPLALSDLATSSLAPLTPLGASLAPAGTDADWDYSETAWWGWVMLVTTWVVFVTGMGSCLGVWSWAWDVGTTPYAPPELEDDPTLPIVGYYPALLILTSVMAWVWVVVAWIGMKYFRHAKITGD